jgi:hypothetical protein
MTFMPAAKPDPRHDRELFGPGVVRFRDKKDRDMPRPHQKDYLAIAPAGVIGDRRRTGLA